MYHYSQLLKEFQIEVDTEHVKFLNTCENILQDVVSPSVLVELLKPGSERWGSPDLRKELETQLRERSVKQFLLCVEGLNAVLEDLNRMFPKDANGKVHFQ
jgi:hypothetical protein